MSPRCTSNLVEVLFVLGQEMLFIFFHSLYLNRCIIERYGCRNYASLKEGSKHKKCQNLDFYILILNLFSVHERAFLIKPSQPNRLDANAFGALTQIKIRSRVAKNKFLSG